MLNPGLNRYPVTRFALLSMVFVALALTLFLSAASSGAPIRSTAGKPASPATEKPEAAIRVESERARTPVLVEPQAVTPISNEARAERVAPAIAKLFGVPQGPSVPQRDQRAGVPSNTSGRRGSALDRALLEVAEDGDIADIEELLRAGANVNGVVPGDGTPLIAAAGEGQLETVRYLLDRGADPNLPASGDGNPLIAAAREGHDDVVRLLLDRGADPNRAVDGDGNPLIGAASEGHASVVTLLLDRGASIDQMVPGDENALIQASAEGHLNIVKLLVSRHADVNARAWIEAGYRRPNGEWRTPLSVARREGNQDIVEFLLSVGARD